MKMSIFHGFYIKNNTEYELFELHKAYWLHNYILRLYNSFSEMEDVDFEVKKDDMLKLLKLVNECLEKQDKKTIEDYFNCTIDDDGKGFDMDYYIDEFLVFIETFEEPILNKNTKFIYTFRL